MVIADRIVLAVCEIPDRNSPDDQPEMMLVTPEELRSIVCAALEPNDTADSAVPDGREGMPLRAIVENDQLSIAIGVLTLAFAFENSEENNPYDEDFCDTKRQLSISDPSRFAKDVCHELNREGEDGSTPFTRFLDSMMGEAVNQGSLGIHDPDETADSLEGSAN